MLTDTLANIARHWLLGFQTDITRYIVAAPLAWLVICVLLAPVLKGRKIRPDTAPMRQHLIELFCSVRSVAVFSTVALLSLGLERAGAFYAPTWREDASVAWIVISFALTVLAHDAYFYWAHRIMHRPQLFRAFHRRHHLSHNPTPFTAYSFDLGEAAVMALFTPLWLLAVPVAWPAFAAFMIHQIARNVMGHCGYELFPSTRDGRPLFGWMSTVTHHDLHHAQAGYNYGLYFTWWDRWMGTEHPEYAARFAAAVRKAPRPAPSPALAGAQS
jgi:sterol desaturase/sphingolipid hydroxylase (fatty acid hydroxylase superfamily)